MLGTAPTKPAQAKCQALTKAGEPCPFAALEGGQWCLTHDPQKEAERRAARSRGGQARQGMRYKPRHTGHLLETSKAVANALSEAFADVQAGRLHWRVGQALASIASVILRALELARSHPEQNEQINALEAINRIRALYGMPPKQRDEQRETDDDTEAE